MLCIKHDCKKELFIDVVEKFQNGTIKLPEWQRLSRVWATCDSKQWQTDIIDYILEPPTITIVQINNNPQELLNDGQQRIAETIFFIEKQKSKNKEYQQYFHNVTVTVEYKTYTQKEHAILYYQRYNRAKPHTPSDIIKSHECIKLGDKYLTFKADFSNQIDAIIFDLFDRINYKRPPKPDTFQKLERNNAYLFNLFLSKTIDIDPNRSAVSRLKPKDLSEDSKLCENNLIKVFQLTPINELNLSLSQFRDFINESYDFFHNIQIKILLEGNPIVEKFIRWWLGVAIHVKNNPLLSQEWLQTFTEKLLHISLGTCTVINEVKERRIFGLNHMLADLPRVCQIIEMDYPENNNEQD